MRIGGLRAWWLVALCMALPAACSRTPPEQRLRESVVAMQAAIEARQISDVRELLADDFIGPGGMDRSGAARLAQLSFMRHRDIGVAIVGPLDLSLQDERARLDRNGGV